MNRPIILKLVLTASLHSIQGPAKAHGNAWCKWRWRRQDFSPDDGLFETGNDGIVKRAPDWQSYHATQWTAVKLVERA